VKKIKSPYLILFREKRKIITIMKKNSCVDFFVKKEEKKKSIFLCGVLFREDSFRDIVRKKKENLSMMRAIYQAANVTKAW
jgi:hypothetical protein